MSFLDLMNPRPEPAPVPAPIVARSAARHTAPIAPDQIPAIERIRKEAERHRASPRRPVHGADPDPATALACNLGDAIGKRVYFLCPECSTYTFDEAWIARLLSSFQAGDTRSTQFLLSSRVLPAARGWVAVLASDLATLGRKI
ncbi:MAG: hypothetical protein AAFR35_04000 [Pseudomonadota bacterium]